MCDVKPESQLPYLFDKSPEYDNETPPRLSSITSFFSPKLFDQNHLPPPPPPSRLSSPRIIEYDTSFGERNTVEAAMTHFLPNLEVSPRNPRGSKEQSKKYDNLKYIFCKHIPMETLYHVLDQICVKKDKYYLIDFNAFRLLQFHKLYPGFSKKIIDAYKPSKQYFVTRALTYNSFITIVRHICRVNRVEFDTKFNYQHSQYNIDYYIYHHPSI